MKRHPIANTKTLTSVFSTCCLSIGLLLLARPNHAVAEPTPASVAAFNSYIGAVESRLAQQHRSQTGFLPSAPSQADLRLRRGELIVERLTPSSGVDLPGAMLHHWRGTAFVAGARAAGFERLMRNVDGYPAHFSPQVVQAKLLSVQGGHLQATLRVRQRHGITVVMDTVYDIAFGQLDPQHGYSMSRSTRVAEIEAAGTSSERALSPGQEHGFLWRQNTYWTFEERDCGLLIQIESVSLTRSIPTGLGWLVGPFVESVPRESLEFTLRATSNALRK
ncbi:MAG: hypothetical protein ABSE46_07630 [Terracidiphilus sp.]|jgi:hypothetical protein